MLGRSLQSVLDDNPKHVLSMKSVFQMACRLVGTLQLLAPVQGMGTWVLDYLLACSVTHSACASLCWPLGAST